MAELPVPDRNLGQARVVLEHLTPLVDHGRFAAKSSVGETVRAEIDAFADGHDKVSVNLLWRPVGASHWNEVQMHALPNDRWFGEFDVHAVGWQEISAVAWVDRFATWRYDFNKRVAAGQDVRVDLQIGAQIVDEAVENNRSIGALATLAKQLRSDDIGLATQVALSPALEVMMRQHGVRHFVTEWPTPSKIFVDRVKGRFSSWYEFFPRSASNDPNRHGNFKDVEKRLDYVQRLGFDVLYLPPIHPIGRAFRKGKNNSPTAGPDDVGSPWAIGGPEGGHDAIHPQLGTLADFDQLVKVASDKGIEIAMDLAFQCSPDHPYVKQHPEWFRHRPDGTIQYAENPPKKYQDIYPFDFECDDFQALWDELLRVTLHWVGHGIKIFRVDNPHTKPFPFWEWLISEVKKRDPDVLFLAEAFTRPKVMNRLGKLGFTQSYTYFTWRNDPYSIREYYTSLTTEPLVDFFRPNAWPNTPDILPTYLQTDARAAHIVRAVLAATLSSNWGVYGPAFELMDTRPAAPGKEEYLDSEKYQTRQWDMNNPNSLSDLLARLNRIRKENQALQRDRGLTFHNVDNGNIVCFSKVWNESRIIVVANTDPYNMQWGNLALNLDAMGLSPHEPFQVHDLLTDARYIWQGWHPVVGLDPGATPVHVLAVRKRVRNESDFDYFV